ncbi:MAG: cyclase family protein [Oscillochloridaceae bacterium]|nr:cyclase family protein [Chloroflexaceae bacterium]MDW8388965.1 cyclase family protein [Oscillochloridaceae bacterium]
MRIIARSDRNAGYGNPESRVQNPTSHQDFRGLLTLLALAALLSACAAQPEARAPAPFSRAVDLSHVVHENVPLRAGEPRPRLLRAPDGAVTRIELGSNTGSLLRVVAGPDAELTSVEHLSPRDLVLPAVVIDARDRAQDAPDFALSAADVRAWEQRYGSIPPGTLVLLATGWDVRWGDPRAYLGADAGAPGFGPDAADLLLNQRGVAGLGVDAPGRLYAPARGFALFLENLTSLEQVPPTGATVVIGALKVQAASSAPARVLALAP